jgi:hypothetical protein
VKKTAKTKKYLSASGDDEISCLLCGQPLRAFCTHLYWKHGGMTIAEYKKRFGLLQSAGLLSKESKKLYSEQGKKRKDIEELRKMARSGMKIKMSNKVIAINWNAFLEKLSKDELSIDELQHSEGMPTRRTIQRKLNSDRAFKRKYEKIMLQRTLKYGITDKIIALRKKGLSYVKIAAKIGKISKSHVGNIINEAKNML